VRFPLLTLVLCVAFAIASNAMAGSFNSEAGEYTSLSRKDVGWDEKASTWDEENLMFGSYVKTPQHRNPNLSLVVKPSSILSLFPETQ